MSSTTSYDARMARRSALAQQTLTRFGQLVPPPEPDLVLALGDIATAILASGNTPSFTVPQQEALRDKLGEVLLRGALQFADEVYNEQPNAPDIGASVPIDFSNIGGGGGGALTFVSPVGPGPFGAGVPIQYTLPPGLTHAMWIAMTTTGFFSPQIGGNNATNRFTAGAFDFCVWNASILGPSSLFSPIGLAKTVWLGAVAADAAGILQPVAGMRTGSFVVNP